MPSFGTTYWPKMNISRDIRKKYENLLSEVAWLWAYFALSMTNRNTETTLFTFSVGSWLAVKFFRLSFYVLSLEFQIPSRWSMSKLKLLLEPFKVRLKISNIHICARHNRIKICL